jgi:assimilatory nitrate reductase catalytic subunit
MSAVATTCPYCGVGCGLRVTATEGVVTVRGDDRHPANFGRLCSKGSALGETVDLDGRLLAPRIAGRTASWDEALDTVAGRFADAIARHGPGAVAFYVSGQLLTEDYYVANKLMKGFIGSGNIDTNSRLCMASAVAGYRRAFGADLVPNRYTDIEQADLLVLAGANMAWCHPVLFQRIRQAKAARPGLRLVVIDPRRTASCDIADLHLPLIPGSDVTLFAGLLDYLRREDAIDWEYIDAHTEGFGLAGRAARDSHRSIPKVARACGLGDAEVAEFFRLFARTPKTVTLFSQGINQSTAGTDKVNSIINVHLATGRIGKPGTGPFSLTGQPNAMGGREVGGLANQLAAHMDFTPEHCDRVRRFWGSPTVATAPGLKAVDLFRAVGAGRIKALWIMSTNPVVSMPEANAVRAALETCAFVVVSDCIARTDTTAAADVLLPAAAWGEKSGTVTNSERRISRQRAFLPVPGEARADWWIVAEVAKRMGFAAAFDYSGPAAVFREHAALSGFENGGTRAFDIGGLAGLDDAAYENLEPVRWPVRRSERRSERGHCGAGELLADGRFFTSSGKAQFVPVTPCAPAALANDDFPYVMLTGRIRDQWHTMTRTGKSPRLAQTKAEPCIEINTRDAIADGLANGSIARIASEGGEMLARVVWSDEIRRGQVFVPMHWTAQLARAGRVGPLIAAAVDPVSGQPELKHTPVRVQPLTVAWYGFVLNREALDPGAVLDPGEAPYVVGARGAGYWRYELAGDTDRRDWAPWARQWLGADGDWVDFADSAGGYRGARLDNGRLSGCVFISPKTRLPDRNWLGRLFAREALNDSERASLLAGRPADGAASLGPIICACFSVGRDALIRAIAGQEVTDVKAIGRLLKAGTNCGSCVPELNGLLSAHRPAADAGAEGQTAATARTA